MFFVDVYISRRKYLLFELIPQLWATFFAIVLFWVSHDRQKKKKQQQERGSVRCSKIGCKQ